MNPLNYVSLQTDPMNYLPLGLSHADETQRPAGAARFGSLSKVGEGSRNARIRAQQLNTHILAQSLTYFLRDLAQKENVILTQLVACKDADHTAEELVEAVRMRSRIITDDCLQYTKPDKSKGVGFTTYR